MASTAEGNAQITVLYDAFGKTSTMQKDWGYAALVEYGGKRILFDTGNNPEILAQNTKAKGVDLTKLDFVVMSHRHAKYFGKVRDDINRAVCCVSQLKVKANDGDSTES
jgi:7,8-dihydropterin-6-yl-methyl-4-(beta-D-ribofuranosyl)aminobenzene 5'-phosphate synthase